MPRQGYESTHAAGALAPLRHRAFFFVWSATLLGNIGLWMRDVASGWLMTTLDPRPGMVALIQAASYLPVAIFVLPAGVVADVFDRRAVIVMSQFLLCAVGILLGVLTHLGALHPWGLIVLCLSGGIVAAFAQPAWQAILPEVLPMEELPKGMALYNLGFNIARVIGPATAGAIIAASGIVGAYAANVALFLVGAIVLVSWKHSPAGDTRRPEPILSALATGARFVRDTPDLRRVLLRAPLFFLCFSSYWALLPLIARQQLHGTASYYGALLGCLGAGAIIGAFVMPGLRMRMGGGKLVRAGSLVSALTTVVLALTTNQVVAALAAVVAGLAWMAVVTTFPIAAQALLPNWVRARGMAFYLLAFYGSLALGSVIWGQVAHVTNLRAALLGSGIIGGLVALAAERLPWPGESKTHQASA
ncbi:MAG TPA: MFS transporter [Steroidobacteraceae bacterium]|nr:MFS transporter [Steroidobacteraceae bacterium]